MKMVKVESSNIEMIGWEEGQAVSFGMKPKDVLRITFKNGRTYDYYNFPEELYLDFLNAKSIGSFFHANINKKYDYELVKK